MDENASRKVETETDPNSESKGEGRFPLIRTALVVISALVLYTSVSDYYNTDLVIEPISVSVRAERAGLSSSLINHKLAEEIRRIISSTNVYSTHSQPSAGNNSSTPLPSMVEIHPNQITSSPTAEVLDIEVPETKLSLKTLTQLLERFLPARRVSTISGDATLLDNKLALSFSIETKRDSPAVYTWNGSGSLSDLESEIKQGAAALFEIIDPTAAAMRHYYWDEDSQEGLATALSMLERESHSASTVRARSALLAWSVICGDRDMFPCAFSKVREAAILSDDAEARLLAESAIEPDRTKRSKLSRRAELEVRSHDEALLLALASAFGEEGNDNESAKLTEQAFQARKTPATLVARADTLRGVSPSQAIRRYREALSLDPSYWPAYIGLSITAQQNQDWSGARSFAKLAVSNALTPEEQSAGLTQLGALEFLEHKYDKALKHLKASNQLTQGNLDADELIARTAYEQGDSAAVEKAFKAAKEESIFPSNIVKDWADMLTDGGDYAGAERLYLRAIAENSPVDFPEAHDALGYVYLLTGRDAQGTEEFQRAVRVGSYPARFETDWGRTLISVGRFEDAEMHLRNALLQDPQMCDAALLAGRLAFRKGLDDDEYQPIADAYNSAYRACFRPGAVMNELAAARDDFANWLGIDLLVGAHLNILTWDPGATWSRVQVASYRNDETAIVDGLSKVPYPAGLEGAWGRQAAWEGQNAVSEQRLHSALTMDTENSQAKTILAAIEIRKGELTRTALDERLPELINGDTDVLLGNVCVNLGWTREAEEIYRNTLRLVPYDEYANLQLGKLLLKAGKSDESVVRLQRAAAGYLLSGAPSQAAVETYNALLDSGNAGHFAASLRSVYETELRRDVKRLK